MAGRKDYIPSNTQMFDIFLRNVLEYVRKNQEEWKNIPEDVITSLTELHDHFSDLLKATSGQHTSAQTYARNEAQAAASKALRAMVNQYLRFAPVSNVDRVEMGIPNRDGILSTVPAPSLPAAGTLAFPALGLIEIRDIHPEGNRSEERVRYGVRIYYGIMGTPGENKRFRLSERPLTGEDLPHSVFTRQRRYRFDFAGERGREVFFCMRCENSKGQAGPWGKIISAFVP